MAVRWGEEECGRVFMFRDHPAGEEHGEQCPAVIFHCSGEVVLYRHGFPEERFPRMAQARRAAERWEAAGGFEDGIARVERASAERAAGVVRFSVAR